MFELPWPHTWAAVVPPRRDRDSWRDEELFDSRGSLQRGSCIVYTLSKHGSAEYLIYQHWQKVSKVFSPIPVPHGQQLGHYNKVPLGAKITSRYELFLSYASMQQLYYDIKWFLSYIQIDICNDDNVMLNNHNHTSVQARWRRFSVPWSRASGGARLPGNTSWGQFPSQITISSYS